jgi:hypothetical protein
MDHSEKKEKIARIRAQLQALENEQLHARVGARVLGMR